MRIWQAYYKVYGKARAQQRLKRATAALGKSGATILPEFARMAAAGWRRGGAGR